MIQERGGRDEERREHGRRLPSEVGGEPGLCDAELAGEQREGRKPEQCDERERDAASERGPATQRATKLGNARRALRERELADCEKRDRLAERVREHLEQECDDCQLGADRGGERDDAHVLDAGIGEQAFRVSLAEHQRRGDEEREQRGDEQQAPQIAGTGRGIDDDLEPQEHRERDGEQHTRHERRYGCRSLTVRVGQPRVHRREPDLRPVTEEQQAAGEPRGRRVEAPANRASDSQFSAVALLAPADRAA